LTTKKAGEKTVQKKKPRSSGGKLLGCHRGGYQGSGGSGDGGTCWVKAGGLKEERDV